MAYLLDADVLIRASNFHYGFDFCPAFWSWVLEQHRVGKLFSVGEVGREVRAIEDELSTWAKERGDDFFLPTSAQLFPALRAVSTWVTSQAFSQAAIHAFLLSGDYQLIAQAYAAKHVVVTHEVSAPLAKKRVKIPDVCRGLDIDCINPFQMLRREGANFILGKAQEAVLDKASQAE